MKIVIEEIENTVQSRKAKAVESLEVARLENSLVFQLDDEPIPGVDTLSDLTISSIALGSWSQIWKRDADSSISTESYADVILMNNGLKDVVVAIADVYNCSNANTYNTNTALASSVN